MYLTLNATSVGLVYVFFYTRGQLHLPNYKKLFGSTFRQLERLSLGEILDPCLRRWYVPESSPNASLDMHEAIELTKTSMKLLDKEAGADTNQSSYKYSLILFPHQQNGGNGSFNLCQGYGAQFGFGVHWEHGICYGYEVHQV